METIVRQQREPKRLVISADSVKDVETSEAEAAHSAVVEELRVEHVLTALDQIAALCAQVRVAVEGLPPGHVLRRRMVDVDYSRPMPRQDDNCQ